RTCPPCWSRLDSGPIPARRSSSRMHASKMRSPAPWPKRPAITSGGTAGRGGRSGGRLPRSVRAASDECTTGRRSHSVRATSALRIAVADLSFQNPIVLAARTAGYGEELERVMSVDALGGLVTKAVSAQPRAGAPAPRVAEFEGGRDNAVGWG